MNVDMEALLRAHGVPIAEGRDKHRTPGWLNVNCPFCGDKKKHLGWNISGQYWNCYKCGSHPTDDTLAELLGIGYHEVYAVKARHAMRPGALLTEDAPIVERPQQVIVPGSDLLGIHWDYLLSRKYNPERVSSTWGLRGTNHLAKGTNKFRIICPIYCDGVIVSWQGRDVTGKSPLRWKSCPKELELRDHKHCLGGEQLVPGDAVAVVEGFTDAWRMGPGCVCTFGTDYLEPQVNRLRRYKRRFIVLDSKAKDPNASVAADRLAHALAVFGGETVLAELNSGDPGELAQAEADYLMTNEWRVR